MVRVGIWLLVIGANSFVLPVFGLQFRVIDIFGDAQQVIGGLVAITGLALILLPFFTKNLNLKKASNTSYPRQFSPVQGNNAYFNPSTTGKTLSPAAEVAAPLLQTPGTFRPASNTPPVQIPQPLAPTPLPASELPAFQQAVTLAQAGRKMEAYSQLKLLAFNYPADTNLLLWLAFTSPSHEEANQLINSASSLEPANPVVVQAREWMSRQVPVRV
ncbi:MAG TPA: hypothetical protein VH186_17655 [Chloroflexia bacterium]|nr:hypothetical protein [Chloroflexia bacterium]